MQHNRPTQAIVMGLVAVALFAGSPIATKVAVHAFEPILAASLRGVVAALAAVPIVLALRLKPPGDRDRSVLLWVSGVAGFVGFPLLFAIGQRHTSATHGALILAALPLFTGLYAAIWERRRPSPLWWCGCAVASVGETVLISSRASDAADATLFGDGMIVLASLVASLGYVAGGKLAGTGYSSWSATFLGVIGGGILLAPILWSAADAPTLTTADLADWVGIAYLAVGVSILGYVAWYWALGVGGVARIGVIQFLQPPLGVVLAVALLDEPVTIPLAVAGALILIGVAVAQKKPANA